MLNDVPSILCFCGIVFSSLTLSIGAAVLRDRSPGIERLRFRAIWAGQCALAAMLALVFIAPSFSIAAIALSGAIFVACAWRFFADNRPAQSVAGV